MARIHGEKQQLVRGRRGNHLPLILLCLGWWLVSGVWSAWDSYQGRPARIVSRFDRHLARWGLSDALPGGDEVRALIADLGDASPVQRWRAAEQLGDRAAGGATLALVRAMRDEAGTRRPCLVAHCLGRVGDRRAVPALIAAVDHPSNADLRVCAAGALGEIGDPRAIGPLIRAYESRASLTALRALGRLGDPGTREFLQSVAQRADHAAHRWAAEHALLLIGLLEDEDPVRALTAALPALPDASRVWAIGRLAGAGDARAIGPLYALASDTGAGEEVRICAAAAIAAFGPRGAREIRDLMGCDDPLGRALGGLAAARADAPALEPAAARLGEVEPDGFVRRCLALANGGKADG